MTEPTFHEFSGFRSAPGLKPWRRCTCGIIAHTNHDAEVHLNDVRCGTVSPWEPRGLDYPDVSSNE